MQKIVEIIILYVFFPAITSKYVYRLSEKPSFISFEFLGLRDPHFQETGYFLCLLELWNLLFIKFGNLLISAVIGNKSYKISYKTAVLNREQR